MATNLSPIPSPISSFISPGTGQSSQNADSSRKDLNSLLETINSSNDPRLSEVLCEIAKQGADIRKDLWNRVFLSLFRIYFNGDGSFKINFDDSVCPGLELNGLIMCIFEEIREMPEDVQCEVIDILLAYFVKIPLIGNRSLTVGDFVDRISSLRSGERRKKLWLTLLSCELRLLSPSCDETSFSRNCCALCRILSGIERDSTGELWSGFLEALQERLLGEEGASFDDILLVLNSLGAIFGLNCSQRIQIIERVKCIMERIPERAQQSEHMLPYINEFILPLLRDLIPLLETGKKSYGLFLNLHRVLCELAGQKADDQDFLCGIVFSTLLEKCRSDKVDREACDLCDLVSCLLTETRDERALREDSKEDLAGNGREAFLRHVLKILNSGDSDPALLRDSRVQCSILWCTAACKADSAEELWCDYLGVFRKQWSEVSANILPLLRDLIPLLETGKKSYKLFCCLHRVLCELAEQKADDQDFLCGMVFSTLLEKCRSDKVDREACDLCDLVSYFLTETRDERALKEGSEEDLAGNGREAFLRHVLKILNSVDSDPALLRDPRVQCSILRCTAACKADSAEELWRDCLGVFRKQWSEVSADDILSFLKVLGEEDLAGDGRKAFLRYVLKILNSGDSDPEFLRDLRVQCSILRCAAACEAGLSGELWVVFLGILQKQWSGASADDIPSFLKALKETANEVGLRFSQRKEIVGCIPKSMQQQKKVSRCMREFTHSSRIERFLIILAQGFFGLLSMMLLWSMFFRAPRDQTSSLCEQV